VISAAVIIALFSENVGRLGSRLAMGGGHSVLQRQRKPIFFDSQIHQLERCILVGKAASGFDDLRNTQCSASYSRIVNHFTLILVRRDYVVPATNSRTHISAKPFGDQSCEAEFNRNDAYYKYSSN
jgi:hypothetical protein